MKKFLAVLLPVILIGSLASSFFVAASPCPVELPRPEIGWTTGRTPALTRPGTEGDIRPHEVWSVHHEWNEDGTAVLRRVRLLQGVGAVNLRNSNHPGGRAIPTEYLNVISQVYAGTVAIPTGRFWRAWTGPICTEWWVEVDTVDIFGRHLRGVIISTMLVNIADYMATGNPEAGAWTPGAGAIQMW